MSNRLLPLVFLSALVGCAHTGAYYGRECVSSAIQQRTDYPVVPTAGPAETALPPTVQQQDGLAEDEAVAIALWNSPAFQEALADLGLTRADLIQAGQLTNPDFTILFPVGVKQLEFTLNVPLEALWLRPRRIAAAQIESRRVGQRLVQDGLNLIRDVRAVYADLLFAHQRLRFSEDGARLRGQIAEISLARLRAGATSNLEVSTARIDHLLEEEQVGRVVHDVELARQRLRFLLGVHGIEFPLEPLQPRELPRLSRNADDLVREAVAARPDLCAAQLAVQAACERWRLARCDYFSLSAGVDANQHGKKGFEIGPGLKFTVPLFHHNQGAIARAAAEVQRAQWHYAALCATIELEVRQAHTKFLQAEESRAAWDQKILPMAQEAVAAAERAYRNGGAPLLLMLENSRQLLVSQLRQAQAVLELRRAAAELERSVGHKIFLDPLMPPPLSNPPAQPPLENSP